MRVLETNEKTLAYAQKILAAGASILTVHGRQRDQKGHKTGLADWSAIRFLRDNLPPETVLFANGNILQHEDIRRCLNATGADAVMVAEANLNDPSVLASPPALGDEGHEYWRGRDGKGGYRMDAVFRRYLDIIHRHVLEQDPPQRRPLFVFNAKDVDTSTKSACQDADEPEEPPSKRQKHEKPAKTPSPNLRAMQAHLFGLLRPLVTKHTHVRDALAKCRSGNVEAFEEILIMVEDVTRQGLMDYETGDSGMEAVDDMKTDVDPLLSSVAAVQRCRRPWWICQPHVRPMPQEALEKGAIALSKKEKARLGQEAQLAKETNVAPQGKVESVQIDGKPGDTAEIPKEGLVCG